MIKAAINGKRTLKEYNAIPVFTSTIAEAARKSILAGADAIHFHVRNKEGEESFSAAAVAEQVSAVKAAVPNIPVGISTGDWIEPDLKKRVALIGRWETLPDFVSLNFAEKDVNKIAAVLLSKKIKIEAGLSSKEAASRLVGSGFMNKCFRILIEPEEQDFEAAKETINAIESIILGKLDNQTILLHGFEKTAWPVFQMASKKGYGTRMGFEDTLFLPSGLLARDNADLITEAAIMKIK